MKPLRNLFCPVIFLSVATPVLHAATDITISNALNSDISGSTPFADATNNGGNSNLQVVTLVGALGPAPVLVTTSTAAGVAPVGGRITVLDPVTWNSGNSLSLAADSNILLGAAITNTSGGGLDLASATATAFNADIILNGGTSQLAVLSNGITQGPARKLLIGGLADLNAGSGAITLLEANDFGSLHLAGGAVTLSEDSSTLLTGVSATSLHLTSAGAITDSSGAVMQVSGLATFKAAGSAITLGENAGDLTNFGGLDLTGTAVSVTEDSATMLGGVAATSLNLTSAGAITDSAGAVINVTGPTSLNGTSILLGGAGSSTTFGSLNFKSAGSVSLQLDSGTTLAGANTASAAALDGTGVSVFAAGSTLNAASFTLQGGMLDLSGNNLANGIGLTVADGATLNLGAFNETVGTLTLNNGSLVGTGTLTTAAYDLNGGTVNANLGTGILNQLANSTTLGGTAAAATVNVNGGTLNLGAADRFNDAARITVGAATLNLGSFDDTVGNLILDKGTLAGAGTLTAATYALHGATVSANLGTGILNQLSDTTSLDGTSAASTVNVTGGTLALGAADRLNDAAAVTVSDATLNLGGFNDTVGTLTLNPAGKLVGMGTLTATGGVTLNGVTVSGNFSGNTTSTGMVLVSGAMGGGSLLVRDGSLTLTGTSTHKVVRISRNATLLDSSGGLDAAAVVINAGLLNLSSADTVAKYTQHQTGRLAAGTALTATGGATLNGGTIAGDLVGDIRSTGDVLVSGSLAGRSLHVDRGTLTLAGKARANTTIHNRATLMGTGSVTGNLSNHGTLAVGAMGETLTISGRFITRGTVRLSLKNPENFEQIKAGSANLGGKLVLKNTGAGLARGEVVKIIDAGFFSNNFTSFKAVNFDNGLVFNEQTGKVIGLGVVKRGGKGGFMNLTENQANTYLSMYEDSVRSGRKDLIRTGDAAHAGAGIKLASGRSSGDPLLVSALNQATFANPGSIDLGIVNRLSPEAHRGMSDYTEQAMRSHGRQAVDAAPVSTKGGSQVFATVHSNSDGVENSATDAGYDIEMIGATAGVRHDIDANLRVGGLLGMDDGSIEGSLIDTDAQGFVLGGFARYLFPDAGKTTVTGSVSYGRYEYDAARHSFGGDAIAGDIGSDGLELALGVSGTVYEKHGLRILPGGTLSYLTGSVDDFEETGPGVPLAVGSQDIDSLLLDIGVDVSYQVRERVSLVGRLAYVHDFSGGDESVSGAFVASGTGALPFSVNAPGIDNQAVTLGLGLFYDINDKTRVGATYRGDFRFDSEFSQTFGLGVSHGF